jgi:hypothetical protein
MGAFDADGRSVSRRFDVLPFRQQEDMMLRRQIFSLLNLGKCHKERHAKVGLKVDAVSAGYSKIRGIVGEAVIGHG